jgi:tRNA threonylcarbamoyladenosine biosynthesis protein TsaE
LSGTAVGSLKLHSSAAEETFEFGRRLTASLQRGDVILLAGALGSGKTTFARGIGRGLRVRGEVTSPTFVLARVHPNPDAGPVLVHVDAYRLHDGAELDDLDVDALVPSAVTIVEWGDGIAEGLADSWLRVELSREGLPRDDERMILMSAHGPRWDGVRLESLFAGSSR